MAGPRPVGNGPITAGIDADVGGQAGLRQSEAGSAIGRKVRIASAMLAWKSQAEHCRRRGPSQSGGYRNGRLHSTRAPTLRRHRLLAMLANSIVTRPLTSREFARCGFRSQAFYTDTRILRHYHARVGQVAVWAAPSTSHDCRRTPARSKSSVPDRATLCAA